MPPAAATPQAIEVRVAVSGVATEGLSEARVRRLLDIELPDGAVLSAVPVGPLGDYVAYVWIDRPTPTRLEIQVRLDGRPVVRRQIAASGLTSDVAARLVAIAASEMIRTEMRKARAPRRPPPSRRPTPEEIELASRDDSALSFSAGPYGAALPAGRRWLAGPGVSVGFRRMRATQSLFARWLVGPLDDGAQRWLEAGMAGDYRVWLGASWRISLGATAAIASLRLPSGASVDGIAGERDTWSARAALGLGAEAKIAGPLWLGLSLEPGVVLRPARYDVGAEAGFASPGETERAVEGAWIGLGLSLSIERRFAPGR